MKTKIIEQDVLPPREGLKDPDIRNGLNSPRLKQDTELTTTAATTWDRIQGDPTLNTDLIALLANYQTDLGYAPLSPLLNLAELTDAAIARANLGLDYGGDGDIWLPIIGGILQGSLRLAPNRALQFIAGALVTAEQGFMEYDGKQLYFVQVGTRRPVSLMSSGMDTTVTVANTTTETELIAETIDANALAISQIFRLVLYGRYTTASGVDTVTLRFKVGGTTILTIVSTAGVVTDAPLFAEFMNTCRATGASGSVWSYVHGKINNVNKDAAAVAAATIDMTAAIDVSVTAQWSAAVGTNTLSLDQSLFNIN